MIYNKYGMMPEPIGSAINQVAKEAAEKLTKICEEHSLTPEEVTICTFYIQQTLACIEMEQRLMRSMRMRKEEKMNGLK